VCCEILGWGSIAKGLVGSVVIEAVGEGVDEGLQLVDPMKAGRSSRRTRIARSLARVQRRR
jgi:hypothetical protein